MTSNTEFFKFLNPSSPQEVSILNVVAGGGGFTWTSSHLLRFNAVMWHVGRKGENALASLAEEERALRFL